jgi:hypothetical protein
MEGIAALSPLKERWTPEPFSGIESAVMSSTNNLEECSET